MLPVDKLLYWEKKTGDSVYLTQPIGDGKVKTYTWKQVADEVKRMAAYLQSLDLPQGSHIAILSKNCAHWIMTDLAIWAAGYVSVPLYPTLTADSVKQILKHSGAKILFVGKLDDWDVMKEGVPSGVHCISYPLSPKNDFSTWDNIVAETAPIAHCVDRIESEIATIIYTSGTTGMPKGVVHDFHALVYVASQVANSYKVSPQDRMLSYLPLSHVAERVCVELMSIYHGFELFFAESLDTFQYDLARAQPTLFFAVPRIWVKFQMGIFSKIPETKLNRLLSIPVLSGFIKRKIRKKLGFDALRLAFSGAAPIPSSLIDWYKKIGIEVLEVYGMTENLAYSHSNKPGKSRVGTVGTPQQGVEVKISEEGEILIRSEATMKCYYREPEKTAEAITKEGYLRTGDRGSIDDAGCLKITGRVKELFKTSKGKYVAPAPIENLLEVHAQIEQVCVVGAGLPQPIVLVMLSEEGLRIVSNSNGQEQLESSFDKLLKKVNCTIDHHERVHRLIVVRENWGVENNFITPTFKIKRNVIEGFYGDSFERWFSDDRIIIWL